MVNGVYRIYQDKSGSTKSIIPPFVISGNKNPMEDFTFFLPLLIAASNTTFGRIECDSQN